MSATLSNLRTQVRENLGQPSTPTSGKWTDNEIRQKINNRIRRLNRYFMTKDIDTSTTVDTTNVEFDFPSGVVGINRIELWNSDSTTNYGELLNWKTWEEAGTKKIIFPDVFNSTTNILKIFGYKRLTELSADADAMDAALEAEELVVLGATMDSLRDLYRKRIDMSRYLAEVQKQSGSTIDVARAISSYKEEYNQIWSRIKTSKVQRLGFGQ